MSLDISSINAKLARSRAHFDAVEDMFLKWKEKRSYRIFPEANSDFTEYQLVFRCSKKLDIQELSLAFGDAIHNLRSALDHLIYAIGVHLNNGVNPPPDGRKLAFPISADQLRFNDFCATKLTTILTRTDRIKFIEALESFQHHTRPSPRSQSLLYILGALDDADKHRMLRLASFQGTEWESQGERGVPEGAAPLRYWFNDGEIKDGSPIASVAMSVPAPNFEFNKFRFNMVLLVECEVAPGVFDKKPIDSLYWDMHGAVCSALAKVSELFD